MLLNVLHQYMEINYIVVHVGFNEFMKGSSEQLKLDFKELIDSLLDTKKILIVSGPMSSLALNALAGFFLFTTGYVIITAQWVKLLLTISIPFWKQHVL